MAIIKKPLVKKSASKAKATVKKVTAKKSVASINAPMQSFRLSRDTLPFFGVRITRQTVYWSILLIFIMIMQLWILNVQLDIIKITDSLTILK